jgi:hypothetical protein
MKQDTLHSRAFNQTCFRRAPISAQPVAARRRVFDDARALGRSAVPQRIFCGQRGPARL